MNAGASVVSQESSLYRPAPSGSASISTIGTRYATAQYTAQRRGSGGRWAIGWRPMVATVRRHQGALVEGVIGFTPSGW